MKPTMMVRRKGKQRIAQAKSGKPPPERNMTEKASLSSLLEPCDEAVNELNGTRSLFRTC